MKMKKTLLIAIDDTDVIDSTGTGRMARDMADHLIGLGMGSSKGITRHQLLVDPRIPYTSHNSSLCVELETELAPKAFFEPCQQFLLDHFREGSDPGLCISHPEDVPDEIKQFGLRAGREVLTKQEAIDLAAKHGIFLVELGGTGGGIIGSLAGTGLRAEGNSGRFIDLPGIRNFFGEVKVADILEHSAIEAVMNMTNAVMAAEELVDSRDWVRPSLWGGKPVLRVRPRLSCCDDTTWTSIEIRQREKRQLMEQLGSF